MVPFNIINFISVIEISDKRIIVISKYKLAFNTG